MFARRIVETIDLVEVTMIETIVKRLERLLDLGKVDDHAGASVNVTRHVNFDLVGVAVQSATLVTRRHVRESMRRLELKLSKNLHHGIPMYLCV
jgi:hypothetical protein